MSLWPVDRREETRLCASGVGCTVGMHVQFALRIREAQTGCVADVHHASSGQNQNLVVVLSVYAPYVACYGPSEPFRGAGQDLLGMIPVSTEPQIFGAAGEPGIEVVVPKKFAQARVVGKHTPPPR